MVRWCGVAVARYKIIKMTSATRAVLVPGPRGIIDASYLAPDCFHISGKGHQIAGIGIWQNLLATQVHPAAAC